MPHPNAVLACPSPSARRRHAAHGQTCAVCDNATGVHDWDWSGYAHRLQLQIMTVESRNTDLRRRLDSLADWARLADDNEAMAARLADVDQTFTALLQTPVIRHEAVDRAHRRIFPPATRRLPHETDR